MAADKVFVIAIDGPAAAGKGTLARRLAQELGFGYLDTGLTYRAVAHAMVQAGLPMDNEELAVVAAQNIDLSNLDRSILSAHEIGEAASKIAVMGDVRKTLVECQRKFADTPPGNVLDGRDIGTVVCPDAQVKLYVTASAEVRAKRRYDEIVANGKSADLSSILSDIISRDQRDMARSESPLKPAQDAHLIDTSKMDIEAAFHAALAIIKTANAN